MNITEQWLADNTFFCKTFRARISKTQCRFNCARTVIAINRHHVRKTKHKWYHDLLNNLTLLAANCYGCEEYEEPDLDDFIKISWDRTIFSHKKGAEYFEEWLYGA